MTNKNETEKNFNEFYNTNYKLMLSYGQRYVDQRTVAEEIVQEAFNKVWQKWDTLDAPQAFLRRTVYNSCNDELRKRRTVRKHVRDISDTAGPEKHYLVDLLNQISTKRRTAIFLRYYGDRTTEEIAEAMNIPTGTAQSLIHRGIADLRLAVA